MFDMGVVNSQLVLKYTNLGAGGRFRPFNFGHCHMQHNYRSRRHRCHWMCLQYGKHCHHCQCFYAAANHLWSLMTQSNESRTLTTGAITHQQPSPSLKPLLDKPRRTGVCRPPSGQRGNSRERRNRLDYPVHYWHLERESKHVDETHLLSINCKTKM